MKRLIPIIFTLLIGFQMNGTIVSPVSRNQSVHRESVFIQNLFVRDTGQVTIITTKGDTIRGELLRSTKIAYKVKYKKIKQKKHGTVIRVRRKRIRKSLIQKIIFSDGRVVDDVSQKFKPVVEKKIKKLFLLSLGLVISLFFLIPYLASKEFIIHDVDLLDTLNLILIGFLIFFTLGLPTVKYERIAFFDYHIRNLYTLVLFPFFIAYSGVLFLSTFYFILMVIFLLSLAIWGL